MKIKSFLSDMLTITLVLLLITYAWQALEVIICGKIQPNDADSIVAIALTASVYLNICFYRKLTSRSTKDSKFDIL